MRARVALIALSWITSIACSASESATPPPSTASDAAAPTDASTDAPANATPDAAPDAPVNGRLVWIGAHPDDELYVAPWLGEQCVEKKLACTMLVMTRGEGGNCKLAGGCAPDLATVRDAELAASAARFGATLVHWDLGDGTSSDVEAVAKTWNDRRGGTLIADVAKILEGATVVASFDPRHGDSCHADHRATGAIAILARRSLAAAPFVTMVASKQIVAKAAPDDPDVIAYDASTRWSFLVDTLKTHASQFTADEVTTVEAVGAAQRKTFLLPEDKAVENDPRYANVCP